MMAMAYNPCLVLMDLVEDSDKEEEEECYYY